MKIIFEKKDYVKAITPFPNGCAFKAIFDGDDTYLTYGCYCLINLLTGAEEQFKNLLEQTSSNNTIKLNISADIRSAMEDVPPCKHCGGSIHKS